MRHSGFATCGLSIGWPCLVRQLIAESLEHSPACQNVIETQIILIIVKISVLTMYAASLIIPLPLACHIAGTVITQLKSVVLRGVGLLER